MKYMIMMMSGEYSRMQSRPPGWFEEMIRFMHQLNDELTRSGELVDAQGLTDVAQAKTVRFQRGMPVVTDGPYAETKESIAGYWIVDVDSEERALDIARRVVAVTEGPIEVRRVADAPPEL
jgi:hypothetical protein